ncbi:somatostatin receptor type 2-like [Tropilaelaps mercedesae]|uniref:Somatostatin receptor type 2-like n=1 Tax=Tropilaelaps mercedesae TaxID=418985 RepID=A0A1V9XTE0_9ACAR|nr:somatostatin receptor type 2-like [Tropilaelaps mercedesae]
MSADRYIAVCHPISSPRYRTPFIAKFVCLTAWTVSALLMVPVYLYATAFDIPKETIAGSNNRDFLEDEKLKFLAQFSPPISFLVDHSDVASTSAARIL